MHRFKFQNLWDPELWETQVIPSMWFPKPPNPEPAPATTWDPAQTGLLGPTAIFRGTKG
jgi:hypothetical protein